MVSAVVEGFRSKRGMKIKKEQTIRECDYSIPLKLCEATS